MTKQAFGEVPEIQEPEKKPVRKAFDNIKNVGIMAGGGAMSAVKAIQGLDKPTTPHTIPS